MLDLGATMLPPLLIDLMSKWPVGKLHKGKYCFRNTAVMLVGSVDSATISTLSICWYKKSWLIATLDFSNRIYVVSGILQYFSY